MAAKKISDELKRFKVVDIIVPLLLEDKAKIEWKP